MKVEYGVTVVKPDSVGRIELRPPLMGWFLAGLVRVLLARGVLELAVIAAYAWCNLR